ncbi:GNAT family N-acetyltransferase, partial [Streptosporangium algeriense]
MSLNLRPLTENDYPAWIRADEEAFGNVIPPHRRELFMELVDFDRSLGAFDGAELVGATCICGFTMTVPGGPVPVAGVTAVAVLPSH